MKTNKLIIVILSLSIIKIAFADEFAKKEALPTKIIKLKPIEEQWNKRSLSSEENLNNIKKIKNNKIKEQKQILVPLLSDRLFNNIQ